MSAGTWSPTIGMAHRVIIAELISFLAPQQAKYIRSRLPNKKRRLFDFYVSEKNFDDSNLICKHVGIKGKGLVKLRTELEESIIMLLGDLSCRLSPQHYLNKLSFLAEGYLVLSHYNLANKVLSRAREFALNAELFSLAIDFDLRIETLLGESGTPWTPAKRREIVSQKILSADLLILLSELQGLKNIYGNERIQIAELLLKRLPENCLGSHSCEIVANRIKAGCHIILGDTEKAAKCLDKCICQVSENKLLLHQPALLDSFLSASFILAGFLTNQGKNNDADELMENSKLVVIENGLQLPLKHLQRVHLLKLQFLINKESFSYIELDSILKSTEEYLKENSPLSFRQRFQIIIQITVVLLKDSNYTLALTWVEKALMFKKKSADLNWLIIAHYLELICLCGNNQDLESTIKKCRYWFQKSDHYNDLLKKLLAPFLAFSKNGHPKIITEIIPIHESISKVGEIAPYFDVFDFKKWAVEFSRTQKF